MLKRTAAKPPKAEGGFNLFRRLDLLYFVLAGFDLLTICSALLLNHAVTTAFEDGVRTSAAWSSRQVEIIHLARLAQQTDAPGNDIFSSRDVLAERARHVDAYARFEAEWDRLADTLVDDPLLEPGDEELLAYLRAARDLMRDVARESEEIFVAYERGNVSNAGALMAIMDRSYAGVNQNLDSALNVVDRIRNNQLGRQVAYARDMRALELLIAVAVLVIVCLVATYGLFIGRTMRANEAQRANMLAELAAGRDRLQRYADEVSHELRGPISKMRLDAEVLLRLDRPPEQYRDGIEGMLSDCERISSIVESLLFLARAENTIEAINRQSLDIKREMSIITEFFNAAAEKAHVEIELNANDGTIWADRSLLQRALSNLISNAIEHTPAGGKITLTARAEKSAVVIDVADTGKGMTEAARQRAFDRFFRADVTRNSAGLGLGLAITKGILDLHGGAISITSEVDVGTRVTLTFPNKSAPNVDVGGA